MCPVMPELPRESRLSVLKFGTFASLDDLASPPWVQGDEALGTHRVQGLGFRVLGLGLRFMLGGSWAVINGVISRVTIHIRGLRTPLIKNP